MAEAWTVYLSGEIHSDWRRQIAAGVAAAGLPVELTGPVDDHEKSDDCGVRILGDESDAFWKDNKGAKLERSVNRPNRPRGFPRVIICGSRC